MKSTMKLLVIISLTTSPVFAGTNLVVNGGFELPNIPANSLEIFTSIPGWTTMYGFSLEIQDHWKNFGLPYEGQQFLELDGNESSGILQYISTQAGEYYQVRFAYAGRGVGLAGNNEIDVYWNGQLLDQLRTTTAYVWDIKEYVVQASNIDTPLEFRDVGESTTFGGYLDAVSVELIPEPASLLLLVLGGLLIRKR